MKLTINACILALFLVSACNTSQTPKEKKEDKQPVTKASAKFPEDWLGTYEGTLELHNAKAGKTSELPMTVTISETDTANRWRWYSKALYQGKEIIKDYALVLPDTSKPTLFQMDENNGIMLDRVLLDGAFYDYFEVGNLGLYGITRKEGDDIHFEISSFPLSSESISTYQGAEFNVDTVKSFKVFNTQKVLLKRVQ